MIRAAPSAAPWLCGYASVLMRLRLADRERVRTGVLRTGTDRDVVGREQVPVHRDREPDLRTARQDEIEAIDPAVVREPVHHAVTAAVEGEVAAFGVAGH